MHVSGNSVYFLRIKPKVRNFAKKYIYGKVIALLTVKVYGACFLDIGSSCW
jgi:hypothetical protein